MRFMVDEDEYDTDIKALPKDEWKDKEALTFSRAKKEAIEHLEMIIYDCRNQIKKIRSYRLKDFKKEVNQDEER